MFLPTTSRAFALACWLLLSTAAWAAPPSPNAELRNTRWALQTLDGEAHANAGRSGDVHVVLNGKTQQLAGFAGCNRVKGRFVQRGTELALSPVASTRMACPDATLQREARFMQALSSIDAFRIEGDVLSLLQGETVRATLRAKRAARR
jgi:heat shock protein HslJ